MITESIQDIFDTDPTKFAIVHQANCFNTLAERCSSGIARLIEERYPEACDADADTKKGNKDKLGWLSYGKAKDGRVIFNAYGQYEFGGERPTNYEALYTSLSSVRQVLEARNEVAAKKNHPLIHLALPYGMGCVRGGGSWTIVRPMIDVIFGIADFDLIICRHPKQAELK